MADIGEIFDQLRTELLADSTLVALLGESNGVFREWPSGSFKKPFIILTLDNLNSQTQFSGTGVYRPNVTFDIIVINPWDAGPVYDALEKRWSIPKEKTTAVTSANFKLTILQFDDLIEVTGIPLREVDTGENVRQFTVPATMRIVKTT